MFPTTLCYIEKDECYLLLHRIRKKVDVNKDKWIGVGGKFKEDESPEECLLREVKEETGVTLTSWRLRGIVTFVSEGWESELMFLYTADAWEDSTKDPAQTDCKEGTLKWVPKSELSKLNLWEGDKVFLRLLEEERPFFSLKLSYKGDLLVYASLDGEQII